MTMADDEIADGFTPLPTRRPRRPDRTTDNATTAGSAASAAPNASTDSGRSSTSVARRRQNLRVPGRPLSPASPLLVAIAADLTETFHYLLARLQLDDNEPLPAKIGVVSAIHGEGVTTVSRAFAAILANDFDTTVCLIDLHSAPATPRNQNDGGPPGLFDVLSGNISLEEALVETADSRLRVLNAGSCSSAEARNLARAAGIQQTLDELQELCAYVVIDVPPILVGSEGLALLRYAEGYLLVVRHGSTPLDQVSAAVSEIGSIRSIGVVLNRVSTKIPKRLQRFFRP